MKKIALLTVALLPLSLFAQNNLKLWYKAPAKEWTQALPIGNGRLGAMVFGRVNDELIQLNENTLWSGGPVKTNVNPDAYKYLLQAREALKQEDYANAAVFTKKMQGLYSEEYLPLGDLLIHQETKGEPSVYYRDLSVSNAITSTRFIVDGVEYTREMFSSAPDQVMVMRLTANKAGMLNFKVGTKSLLRYQNMVIGSNEIAMKGRAPAHVDPTNVKYNKEPIIYDDSTGCNGMRYELRVKAISKDGTVVSDTSGISIKNATEAVLIISAATSFNGFDKCPLSDGKDEDKLAAGYLNAAAAKSWQTLLAAHLADFHKYFNRVSLNLPAPKDNNNATLPTDDRLIGYTKGAVDPGLETLYYQFGRYLLISCSRPGGIPANLQGLWSKDVRAPWSSNYTININTEMNYWPAEMTNLDEMHLPLMDFIKHLSVTGAVTAKEFYHGDGWMAHHNSDIWALSNPVGNIGKGDPKWANWAMSAPWLCQHLWLHYQYTGDREFLKQTAYPLMKGAAKFILSTWLIEDKNGYLLTAPSVSPENDFIDDKGQKGNVSMGTTMDMSIIRDLFGNIVAASEVLGEDKDFRDMIIAKTKKLYPLHIGHKGNLQEWYKDWEDVDPHHRHVSHLFGLHPGHEISPITTPELAGAAKKTLELRGDEGTGWSLAWKINFWARLLDGNHAYSLVRNLLRAAGYKAEGNGRMGDGSGSYPNLFDAHPPFQIDGNFGGVSGMTEMLLQSHLGEISLLPALPDAWPQGSISGLKAQGNFAVSITWENKQLTKATITAVNGGICKLRTNIPVHITGVSARSAKSKVGYVTSFNSARGKVYVVTP